MQPNELFVYTDGACHPQSGTGAWAALIFDEGNEIVLQQIVKDTTHQRMELTAVIEALKYAHEEVEGFFITILYTDSQYVIGLRARREKLEKNNFLTKKGTAIQNVDLVKVFFALCDQVLPDLHKVKAHQKQDDTPNHNRTVDKLVRKTLRAYLKSGH